MESRDLLCVSRPIFASFGLEDFRSRLGREGYMTIRIQLCSLASSLAQSPGEL